MKNINLRIVSAALLAAIISSLAACGGGAAETPPPADGAADTGAQTETAAETESPDAETDPYEPDSLPSDLDLGGRTVTVLGWNHYEDTPEFYAAELTGDVVNDAFYYRNLGVE